jgi:glycosyltransferase involved in cell wall biosynthesis
VNDPRFPLSVIVITRNEERNIVECLQSVAWADDIVVVDAESSDRTAELARQFTHKVTVTPWRGFSEAKGVALKGTSNEWVLWIDADERVPPGLQSEIRETLRDGAPSFAGFSMGRRAYFLGKWIRHCGWYPGYVLRLFRRDAGAFTGSRVHERLDLRGPAGRLKHDLLHHTDETLYQYFAKFNSYTSLAAADVRQEGKRCSLGDLLARPAYMFFKMYLLRGGFLDGMHGLVLSLLSASYVFVKYAKLRELGTAATGSLPEEAL